MTANIACTAEKVDGRLDPATCQGCDECNDYVLDLIDQAVEMGDITPEEAHDQAVQFEQFGVIP